MSDDRDIHTYIYIYKYVERERYKIDMIGERDQRL